MEYYTKTIPSHPRVTEDRSARALYEAASKWKARAARWKAAAKVMRRTRLAWIEDREWARRSAGEGVRDE